MTSAWASVSLGQQTRRLLPVLVVNDRVKRNRLTLRMFAFLGSLSVVGILILWALNQPMFCAWMSIHPLRGEEPWVWWYWFFLALTVALILAEIVCAFLCGADGFEGAQGSAKNATTPYGTRPNRGALNAALPSMLQRSTVVVRRLPRVRCAWAIALAVE